MATAKDDCKLAMKNLQTTQNEENELVKAINKSAIALKEVRERKKKAREVVYAQIKYHETKLKDNESPKGK